MFACEGGGFEILRARSDQGEWEYYQSGSSMGVDEICPGGDWCKGPFATFEEALASSSLGPGLLNLGVCSLNDEYREPLLAFARKLLKRPRRNERFLYRGEHEIDLETWIDPPWRFWPQG